MPNIGEVFKLTAEVTRLNEVNDAHQKLVGELRAENAAMQAALEHAHQTITEVLQKVTDNA